jgi:hypothetical protein
MRLESWTPVPLILFAAIVTAVTYAVVRIVRHIRSSRNPN